MQSTKPGDNGHAQALEAPVPLSIGQLVRDHPTLRQPVVHGLLRLGETANVAAPTKVGKSWLAYLLALCVAAGLHWLGRFRCEQGRVLYLDNELHAETLSYRFTKVAEAMGLHWPDVADKIDVLPLRGQGYNVKTLQLIVNKIEAGRYALVIADAWYRFIPAGVSENDNAQIMALYNDLDFYADRLQAAWVNVHHSTKGSQSDKRTTDVGSGAGSQSRAADSHIVIREHQDDGVFVLDAAVRSWAPVPPVCLRWQFPLWHVDDEADPERLKQTPTKAAQRQANNDREAIAKIIAALAGNERKTPNNLRDDTGLSAERLKRLLGMLYSEGRVEREPVKVRGNKTYHYWLSPVGDVVDE